MLKIGVIGTGVVGSAIALLLRQKGHIITGVCSKNGITAAKLAASVECQCYHNPIDILSDGEIIILSTPDRELEGLAHLLADSGRVKAEQVFYHMSGVLPAQVLHPLQDAGATVGSIHPLQSFATIEKAIENIPGSFFAIQGDDKASQLALPIVEDLSGEAFKLRSEDKALYHLGACVASNYLVGLIHFAVNLYKEIGMSEVQATKALMPLIRGTVANIVELGPVKALTGPLARGDISTIEKHLHALEVLNPGLTEVYKTMGRYTTLVAEKKGSIDNTVAEKLLCVFQREEQIDVQ